MAAERPEQKKRSVPSVKKSYGASILAHGALLGAALALHEPQPPLPSSERPNATQNIPSPGLEAGDVLRDQERIERHNREVLGKLRQEYWDAVDETIETYIRPSLEKERSSEEIRMAPPEWYIHLDVLRFAIEYLEKQHTQSVDIHVLKQRMHADEERMLNMYQKKLQHLFERTDVEWTGDLMHDLPQMQTLLFLGPDRFYTNSFQDQTYFLQGNASFSAQLESGMVNCQVSRMTAILLDAIYTHYRIDRAVLSQLRIVHWDDHIATAIEFPERADSASVVMTFNDIDPQEPFTSGTQPFAALAPGIVEPLAGHVVTYLSDDWDGLLAEQQVQISGSEDGQEYPLFSNAELSRGPMPLHTFVNTFLHGHAEAQEISSAQIDEMKKTLLREGLEKFFETTLDINSHSEELFTVPKLYQSASFVKFLKQPEVIKRMYDEARLSEVLFQLKLVKENEYNDIVSIIAKELQKHPKNIQLVLYRFQPNVAEDLFAELSTGPNFANEWQKIYDRLFAQMPTDTIEQARLQQNSVTAVLIKTFMLKRFTEYSGDLAKTTNQSFYADIEKQAEQQYAQMESWWTLADYTVAELQALPKQRIHEIIRLLSTSGSIPSGGEIKEKLGVVVERIQDNSDEMIDFFIALIGRHGINILPEISTFIQSQLHQHPEFTNRYKTAIFDLFPFSADRATRNRSIRNFAQAYLQLPVYTQPPEGEAPLELKFDSVDSFLQTANMVADYPEEWVFSHTIEHLPEYIPFMNDFLGHIRYDNVKNPTIDQQIIDLYTRTLNQQERLKLLDFQTTIDRHQPIIPFSALFREDIPYVISADWNELAHAGGQSSGTTAMKLKLLYDGESFSHNDMKRLFPQDEPNKTNILSFFAYHPEQLPDIYLGIQE
ncbi:MAG: hypothetical protein HYV32_04045 [Candidatus Kerfeldbacteria bacterium]|nr:hypothetical protein [Candidatus Kerfeldbacteria bacterium]